MKWAWMLLLIPTTVVAETIVEARGTSITRRQICPTFPELLPVASVIIGRGPAGPAGPQGMPGPPGKPAELPDIEAIVQRLLSKTQLPIQLVDRSGRIIATSTRTDHAIQLPVSRISVFGKE